MLSGLVGKDIMMLKESQCNQLCTYNDTHRYKSNMNEDEVLELTTCSNPKKLGLILANGVG